MEYEGRNQHLAQSCGHTREELLAPLGLCLKEGVDIVKHLIASDWSNAGNPIARVYKSERRELIAVLADYFRYFSFVVGS
ncbi:hypothetical protein CDES_04050 [Corynebacterium deserti GIMN1.010]|uniref:Uncharacterized protein n=1 Tax=Corynebacterium deserti GIMN1.010 TaxID=931089 RepID=A0A0M3Q996_9CORY|nr:hypothetical protein CDES_04050 [Corynebacterium deserti GIMN1.010]